MCCYRSSINQCLTLGPPVSSVTVEFGNKGNEKVCCYKNCQCSLLQLSLVIKGMKGVLLQKVQSTSV